MIDGIKEPAFWMGVVEDRRDRPARAEIFLSKFETKNKYFKWYSDIIIRAELRAKTKKEAKIILGYVEGHHIYPSSMCAEECERKDKGNVAFLSAREHFLCNYLLTKFTFGNEKFKMACAFFMMCNSNSPLQQRQNSKYYGIARKLHAEEKSKKYAGVKLKPRNMTAELLATLQASGRKTAEIIKNDPELNARRRKSISDALKGRKSHENSLKNLTVEARARGRSKMLMYRKVFGYNNRRIETPAACFFTYAQAEEFYHVSGTYVQDRIKSDKYPDWKESLI